MDHPNILLVITDQQRVDTLGFMGRTSCRTPNMDRLAREGISFDRAICASTLCMPSRASLFTGQYPHQINMMRNNDTIRVDPHLTYRLREAGYFTGYAGKWHLEPEQVPRALLGREQELGLVHTGVLPPVDQRQITRWFERAEGQGSYDYSVWCEENGLPDGWSGSDDEMRTDRVPSVTIPRVKLETTLTVDQTYDAWVTDIALRFLDERPPGQPFFLVCGWIGPHPPFKIPEPYFSMYDPADAAEPPNFRAGKDKPVSVRRSFLHQLWKDHGETWEAWRKSVAAYWGFTSMMDFYLGRLIQRLEKDQILDNTFVIFCSDHGELLGSHMLWQKTAPYEECLRVPLIMRLPKRIRSNIRSHAAASLIDIPATILSVAGCKIPEVYEGNDLSRTFVDGNNPRSEPYQFSEITSLGSWHGICDFRLVTDERYKFVWHDGDRSELYDLVRDPFELENLADLPQLTEVRQRLGNRLAEWMHKTNDPLKGHFDG